MNTYCWKRSMALLTIAAFLTTGCSTLQNVPLTGGNQSIAHDVKAGESVVVTKKDGAIQKFTVLKVENDALVGHNARISYADMASLDVKRTDGSSNKKALIIGAVVLGAVAVAAASGGGGSGGY